MSRLVTGAAFATLAVLAFAAPAAAEMKVSGSMSASQIKVEPVPLGSPDNVVLAIVDKGGSKSPGSPLDNATMMLSETVVLDKGNGPQSGVVTLANDKGSITSEIHGAVKTVMVDGQPRTSTAGTYKVLSGTGMFAGGIGHGTYSANFTSKTDWVGEWKGVLSLPKQQAAR